MVTLNIAERRVNELQDVLRAALAAKRQVARMRSDLENVEKVLDQACEAVYNATLYDPAGEREDEEASGDA